MSAVTGVGERDAVMPCGGILTADERDDVKDKSYQRLPLGRIAARYLRSLTYANYSPATLEAYELVAARLAWRHHDVDELSFFCSTEGVLYLERFLQEEWGGTSASTRSHRLRILRAQFTWAEEQGLCPWNPVRKIRSPRSQSVARHAYPHAVIADLVGGQDSYRDSVALELLACMALRKNDLRELQIRDVDLVRNLLVLRHGKGGQTAVLPIGFQGLAERLRLHIDYEERAPAEYLVYPREHRHRPMDPSSLHRWFKRCLENAGLPTTIKMHELRHSIADEIRRAPGGDLTLARDLLRHASLKTTEDYLHPTRADLAAAMRSLEESWAR